MEHLIHIRELNIPRSNIEQMILSSILKEERGDHLSLRNDQQNKEDRE